MHSIARQLRRPRHVVIDDLVSAGMVALVMAAGRFDDTKGVKFSSFAAHRIRGAMRDELRTMARRSMPSLVSQVAVSDPVTIDALDELSGLSREAKQIVRWLLEGYTMREVGERLGISESSVSLRVKQIRRAGVKAWHRLHNSRRNWTQGTR